MEEALQVLIVGAGSLARAHALASRQLIDVEVTVICRKSSAATAFIAEAGIRAGAKA